MHSRKWVLLFILLLVSLSVAAQQRQISYIDNDGNWYHVYDTDGKKITTQLDHHPRQELQGYLHSRSEIKSGVSFILSLGMSETPLNKGEARRRVLPYPLPRLPLLHSPGHSLQAALRGITL